MHPRDSAQIHQLNRKPPGHGLKSVIPDGTAGTQQTLEAMAILARAGRRDPLVRDMAMSITRYLPNRAHDAEIARLHNWVKDRVRYVRDPVDTLGASKIRGIEYLSTPRAMLRTRAGDCDEHTVLLSSLLGSLGHPSRFVAVGLGGGPFSHVYLETPTANGHWISAETTQPVGLGWTPERITRRLVRYAD